MVRTIVERFWEKVDKLAIGCWLWTGNTKHGYGYFYGTAAQKNVRAHRFAYEQSIGPIPKGLTIDHLCRNRICVNPNHLEIVTNRVNVLRGVGETAINARKTICIHGHLLRDHNLYITPNGRRQCRICLASRRRQWKVSHE